MIFKPWGQVSEFLRTQYQFLSERIDHIRDDHKEIKDMARERDANLRAELAAMRRRVELTENRCNQLDGWVQQLMFREGVSSDQFVPVTTHPGNGDTQNTDEEAVPFPVDPFEPNSIPMNADDLISDFAPPDAEEKDDDNAST